MSPLDAIILPCLWYADLEFSIYIKNTKTFQGIISQWSFVFNLGSIKLVVSEKRLLFHFPIESYVMWCWHLCISKRKAHNDHSNQVLFHHLNITQKKLWYDNITFLLINTNVWYLCLIFLSFLLLMTGGKRLWMTLKCSSIHL